MENRTYDNGWGVKPGGKVHTGLVVACIASLFTGCFIIGLVPIWVTLALMSVTVVLAVTFQGVMF